MSASERQHRCTQPRQRESTKRDPSVCRYPIIRTPARAITVTKVRPDKALLRHSERLTVVGKEQSYENLRKGDCSTYDLQCDDLVKHMARRFEGVEESKKNSEGLQEMKRKKSRTLVKKRQPWD